MCRHRRQTDISRPIIDTGSISDRLAEARKTRPALGAIRTVTPGQIQVGIATRGQPLGSRCLQRRQCTVIMSRTDALDPARVPP